MGEVAQDSSSSLQFHMTMFRSSKKKPAFRKVVRKTDDADDEPQQQSTANADNDNGGDDEDEDDDGGHGALQSALLLKKKKAQLAKRGKKSALSGGGLIKRSFDVVEDEKEAEGDKKRLKTKKRKRGLGFGGIAMQTKDEDNNNNVENDTGDQPSTNESSSYGKEALEKLKAEQKRHKLKQESEAAAAEAAGIAAFSDSMTTGQSSSMPKGLGPPSTNKGSSPIPPEESYISLRGDDPINNNDNTPYSKLRQEALGDEYAMEEVAADPEESAMWNEQIERRAGIPSSASTARRSTSKLMSLDELSDNLQSTIQSMQTQQEELQNTINRRKADREHAKIDSKAQEETLETAGKACEYYQKLRHDLTVWVGALRDLRSKVTPIQEAYLEMLQVQCEDADHELRSWQDDCIAVLQEHGRISQVLGRQPETPTTTGAPTIDEFGRDIKSQYLRDRDVRFQKRQQNLAKAGEEPSVYELCNTLLEDHNEVRRCDTLKEALRVAMEDLDQDYTSSEGLKDLFGRWRAQYPDDYKQCYASLSFGDLFSIFLQTDLCQSTWFANTVVVKMEEEVEYAADAFPKDVESLLSDGPADENKYIGRSVEKGVLPLLTGILRNNSPTLLFLSHKKSRLLTRLVQLTLRNMQDSPKLVQGVQRTISEAMAKALDSIAIPIVNQADDADEGDAIVTQSTTFITSSLVHLVAEMLSNMIQYWFPLLPIDDTSNEMHGIQVVLNFVNEKFLMLLSSLDKNCEGLSKDTFAILWKALQKDPRNLLGTPSLLLMTMPLRAAGRAYQVDVP